MLRRQDGQAIHVRHTSVCRLVEQLQPPRQTNKVCRTSTQTIGLLMFMVASGLPLYGQQFTAADRARPAQISSEQTKQESGQRNSDASELAETNGNGPSQATAKQTTNSPYIFPTKRERFNRYVKSTVGPFSLLDTGISAGIDQWRDHPDEWEQGASGYGQRFASNFGMTAIRQTVIYGLDSAMGLDTGFKRSQRKGFGPRMKDALLENITSRTRTGKRVISVPRITGVYASRIISAETWYPSRYDYKDGLRSGTRSLLIGFGINLAREFIIRF